MELDITKLREERRPLWMSSFGIDSFAEMLGGGGDIYTDRLPLEWARNAGEEIVEEASEEASLSSSAEGKQKPGGSSAGLGLGLGVNVNVS